MSRLPVDVRDEVADAAERIQREYAPAFDKLDATLGAYWNRTSLNIEALFGKGIGTGWSAHSDFATLSWWPFGKWRQTRAIPEVEADLRSQIERFLSSERALKRLNTPAGGQGSK